MVRYFFIALSAFVAFIGGVIFLGPKADQQRKREKEQFKQEQQKMNTTIQYPMQKVK